MLENNLLVIQETQQFHFEDAVNTRRGYHYQEERFARGHTENIGARIQNFFSPLIEALQIPRPNFGQVACAFSLVEC